MIVQRDDANQATVQIAGSYSQPMDLIEARVIARNVGQGTTTAWLTLDANPMNGQFNGLIRITGGWYKILVRGSRNGSLLAVDSVDRFGVGEVFLITGHSNAQGTSCSSDGVDRCLTLDGASDERVNVIGVDQHSVAMEQYRNTAATSCLPGLAFSQFLRYSGSSPFGEIPWFWGHMGDELVRRINVPVLFYNAGFGGTTMKDNYNSAYDIPFQHSFVRYDLRMPYVNIRNVMNLYVPTTGIRAILVQHGENDRESPADSIYKYYHKVIEKVRIEFGMPKLGFIVALSSFVGARFDNVRSAQFRIIGEPNFDAYMGPDLDNINSQDDRPDGIHFSTAGQVKVGDLWANSINNVLFSITPYTSQIQPTGRVSCGDSSQVTLSQPPGYSYQWANGDTLQNITAGPGIYSARIKNAQSTIFFPPAIVVPATIQPTPPRVTSENGAWTICRSTGLLLTSSAGEWTEWSTGSTSSSIRVTQPGIYTLRAKNPVYGCLSSKVAQAVGLASVDLDLQMQTSRRVVAVNDSVQLSLVVRNTGECDAGPVTITNRLPSTVAVVSLDSAVTFDNNEVSSTITAILSGETIIRQYMARITAPGNYQISSEITSMANANVKATPNNGSANGELDEATVDLRTVTNSSTVYKSPNPSRSLLPSVVKNQLMLDSTKVDLSLQIELSRMLVAVDQTVEVSLLVQNQGGLEATNVVVSNPLPSGFQFVSSASGMSVSSGVVTGKIQKITAGGLSTLKFVVKVLKSGTFTNQAQITSADQPDSDSIPGNGYTNGEDDQASQMLRTATPTSP
ncbi:sialate O-acetylesterase [Spirosoma fluviale]|uniref:Conserved repeat domain-containing protein n=1 Tax=Spirosoma fluviale TaxID=1597977 RepID=A0A286FGN9_9BACT|nr:sialate O-acetylesterase [Spirosoma fluviale]SOD82256.1 conserved repeat domain-containing protein [Spirosoma fluviale]